jgi:hypothetical protein
MLYKLTSRRLRLRKLGVSFSNATYELFIITLSTQLSRKELELWLHLKTNRSILYVCTFFFFTFFVLKLKSCDEEYNQF